MPEKFHRQLAAILFTDMVGYTALMAEDEALAKRLRDRHREVLQECHEKHRGEILQYFGDGTLSIFHSSVQAVQCGIDIQRALQEEPKVALRIGIHSGEVVWDQEGIYGSAVNIASRLESLAEIGSVLVSTKIRDELSNRKEFTFRSLGVYELKNVPKPHELFAVAVEGIKVPHILITKGKGKRWTGSIAKSVKFGSFVGRDADLKILKNVLKEVITGKGTMIGISGEPGIGKTTLVDDFLQDIRGGAYPGRITRGYCSERLAGTEAYLPLLEILEELIHQDENAILLKELAPVWYVQLHPHSVGESKSLELATQATPERRKREFLHFVEKVSQSTPLIIFIDDLHWIDDSSVDLIAYLAPRISFLPILFIGTFRPADLNKSDHVLLGQRQEWQAKKLYREIDLGFLTLQNIQEYLEIKFPGNVFPQELAMSIWHRTEGNPLFMADLIQHLHEKKVIEQPKGKWQLTQEIPGIESELPKSIGGMIDRKMEQLSKDEKTLLQIAAVQGYQFDTLSLATVLEKDSWQVEEMLEELAENHRLIKAGEVVELPSGTISLRYRFVHVLYQNSLYHTLSPTKKVHFSLKVAEAQLLLHGKKSKEIASELAVLFTEGRNWEQATHYFLQATQDAAGKFAYKETIALGKKGLDILKKLPESPENLQRELDFLLAVGLAKSMISGWGSPQVLSDYERAYELSTLLKDIDSLLAVSNGLHIIYSSNSDFRKARVISKQALDLALEVNDPLYLPYAFQHYGAIMEWTGESLVAIDLFRKGLSHYDPKVHPQMINQYYADARECCLSHLCWNLCITGFPDEALRLAHESLEWSLTLDHPSTTSEALTFVSWTYCNLRDFNATRDHAQWLLGLAEEHGYPFRIMVAKCLLGHALVNLEKQKDGLRILQEGLTFFEKTGVIFLKSLHLCLLAEANQICGKKEQGLEAVRECLKIIGQIGEHTCEEDIYQIQGDLLLLDNGDKKSAEASFLKSIQLSQSRSRKWRELRATISLARLWQSQEKTEDAFAKLSQIYDWFTEGFDTVDLRNAKTLLKTLKSELT